MSTYRRPTVAKRPFSRLTDGQRHTVTIRYATPAVTPASRS